MKTPSKTFLIALATTFLIATITTPGAFAKDTITQKEYLNVKANYYAAKKSVSDNKPKDKTTMTKEDIYDVAIRSANERKAYMDKVNKNPKSSKEDKSLAKMNYESAAYTAKANHPGKKGDHVYRNALKTLRIREFLFLDALRKEIIYPKDPRFTSLDDDEPIIAMGGFGRNQGRQSANLARNSTLKITRGGLHKPCRF